MSDVLHTWTAADLHAAPEILGEVNALMMAHGIDAAEVKAISLCLDGMALKLRIHRFAKAEGQMQLDSDNPGEPLMRPDLNLSAGSVRQIIHEARLPDDDMMARIFAQMDED